MTERGVRNKLSTSVEAFNIDQQFSLKLEKKISMTTNPLRDRLLLFQTLYQGEHVK